MDDGSSIPILLVMLLLVALSAFFSASETAFSSLNQIRLKSRADSGDADAAHVLALAQRYDSLLSTILIGNNIVNIALASLGTVFFTRLISEHYGATLSSLVITVVVLVFGEVTPKSLAKEQPERFAMAVAPVMNVLVTLFTPLNLLFGAWKRFLSRHFHNEGSDGITDAELITMVSEAENDGDLTNSESELIRSAIEFDDVQVEDVLTPRVDVVAVADDTAMPALADLFTESGYSRLPVYHENIDNIIGVVHEKDFFAALQKGNASTLDDLVSPTLYTTPSTQISALLRTLREQRHHLAVVVDEYGGTEGIVTLEDILEELVGEIWDEHDEETEDFRRQANGTWLISGSASVSDLYEKLSIPENDEIDSVSVSGLVQECTGRLPKVGDRFTVGQYEGIATKVAHRRVLEVSLRKRTPAVLAEKLEKPHSPRESS